VIAFCCVGFGFHGMITRYAGTAIATLGCATVHKTPSDTGRVWLHVGMTLEEVRVTYRSLSGEYNATFGEGVGEPSIRRGWLHFIKQDPSLRNVKRYNKSTFVFYPTSENMTLTY